jgi:hypothetical protein
MAVARKARLVSGEIMTAASAGTASLHREPRFDFIDAEFETLDRTDGKATTAVPFSAAPKPESLSTPGMDILRKQETLRSPFGSIRGGPLFWTVGLAAAAFWFSGGHALMPQDMFASILVSAQPLRIASVSSRVDTSDGRAILNIDGEAVNDGGNALPMPPLDIQVVASDGATTLQSGDIGQSGRARREIRLC